MIDELTAGAVYRSTTLTVVSGQTTGLIRETWKVKKRGTYFVWLLLGTDSDDKPMDPLKALKQMGFERVKPKEKS